MYMRVRQIDSPVKETEPPEEIVCKIISRYALVMLLARSYQEEALRIFCDSHDTRRILQLEEDSLPPRIFRQPHGNGIPAEKATCTSLDAMRHRMWLV